MVDLSQDIEKAEDPKILGLYLLVWRMEMRASGVVLLLILPQLPSLCFHQRFRQRDWARTLL